MITDSTPIAHLTVAELRQIISIEVERLRIAVCASQREIRSIQIEELCKLIGRSKSSIYKLCSLRQIPHYKVGKELRFDIDEVNKWLQRNRRSAIDEVVESFNRKIK